MNTWLKVSIPVLIAVLLVIFAVSVTLTLATGSGNKVSAASYDSGVTAGGRLADGPVCPGCPGYEGGCCGYNGQDAGPRILRGGCCGAK